MIVFGLVGVGAMVLVMRKQRLTVARESGGAGER
jgi:hypothetical protein